MLCGALFGLLAYSFCVLRCLFGILGKALAEDAVQPSDIPTKEKASNAQSKIMTKKSATTSVTTHVRFIFRGHPIFIVLIPATKSARF